MSAIFKFADWTVQNLVDSVESGVIQLPDLQRPFVWPKTKVRDLLDSMYRGYPVGELMFWNVAADAETRAIAGETSKIASHQIVDGQQRLTSLYAVLKGRTVRDAEYRQKSITISFQPFTHKFEVWTPAFARSPMWIEDVSEFFRSPISVRKAFVKRYSEANGELPEDDENVLEETLSKLDGLKHYVFKVVEILGDTDKKTVADVFVRINSEGVSLKAYDFILTWLSVFWPEGREEIEAFARNSRITAERASEIENRRVTWTAKNHFIAPDAGQLIRVLVAVGQNRAKLGDAYAALQAKDRTTGFVDPQKQDEELDKLKAALPVVLNRLHWDEFLRCLPAAGFRSRKMVTSDINLLSSYVLFLIGRTRHNMELKALRALIARWLFMSQLTGRYTGSGESQLQRDLDRVNTLTEGDGAEFEARLNSVIASELSDDFWTLRLPDALESSSPALSPAYQTYLAALNILDANMFMLESRVRDWMDPTATAIKGIEGHHLFPRNYLQSELGIRDVKRINQVANFAPTDWNTNIQISDHAPAQYWSSLVRGLKLPEQLEHQMHWHGLPENWETLEYEDFLHERRQLMSLVTKEAFQQLISGGGVAITQKASVEGVPSEPRSDDIAELIDAGTLRVGQTLYSADLDDAVEGEITEDRQIRVRDDVFDSLSAAAHHLGVESISGLEYWGIKDEPASGAPDERA